MPQQLQKDIVLAGLSSAGQNSSLSPVQLQKLFFILDREIGNFIGGPRFNFSAYDYGPFDKEVYTTLESLSSDGYVQISNAGKYNAYTLTPQGYVEGLRLLQSFPPVIRDFIIATSNWIKSLSFEELVAAIYKKYPDMKANSIFRS